MTTATSPILVTGSHRSGSTWTGQVLSQARNVRYVQEPFNKEDRDANCPFSLMFQHVDDGDEEIAEKAKSYLLSYQSPSFRKGMYDLLRWQKRKEIVYCIEDLFSLTSAYRTLYKDPLAVMSAEWIAHELGADVVMLIRHPAAFVASIKVKNWEFDFQNFTRQTSFFEQELASFQEQALTLNRSKHDIVDQGILLWNIIYSMVTKYREKHADNWYFVRHEDLSNNPIEEFGRMFSFLGLELTERIKEYILQSTDGSHLNGIKRHAINNIKTWKQRLSSQEIEKIYLGTQKVANHFYSDADWE